MVCDHCTNAFCKACVRRNLGRSAISAIEKSKKWSCYVCDLSQLDSVRLQHRAVLENLRTTREKDANKKQ